MNISHVLGLGFVLIFFGLMVIFAVASRRRPAMYLRDIRAFARLVRAIGLAVEAGKRLHLSLGWGGVSGLSGASGLVGLSVLDRIARTASISDLPPVATSGEGTLAVLSQNTLSGTFNAIGEADQYDPNSGQLTGLTPFAYAAGVLPVIYDQQVSATVLMGHFGSEVVLITDAAERSGSLTLAGSDEISTQAVLYAAAQEPLIGEELYAAGAYVKAGQLHLASLRAQDLLRWLLIFIVLVGSVLKFMSIL